MAVTGNATKTTEEADRRALSVHATAQAYSVSPSLVRLEIARKRLKARRIGRRIVIEIEAIEDWLRLNDQAAR